MLFFGDSSPFKINTKNEIGHAFVIRFKGSKCNTKSRKQFIQGYMTNIQKYVIRREMIDKETYLVHTCNIVELLTRINHH